MVTLSELAKIYPTDKDFTQHYLFITGKSYIQNSVALTGGEATLPSAYIQVGRVGHGSPNKWLLQTTVAVS